MKRTGVDWLSWVADRSRADEAFRHDLDRDGSSAALSERVPQLLAQYPQDVYLAGREQERPSRRHVAAAGIFGPVTDVVCMTDFPPHINANGSTVEVVAVGKALTFAAKAEPAPRLLLSGKPANIQQVTETTGVNADVLARTLLDEGLCAELIDELAAG
ncbi:MAG: hypothetical protein ACRDQ7_06000 [Haloechinothrix sp.]